MGTPDEPYRPEQGVRKLKHRRGTGVRHREPLVTFFSMITNKMKWVTFEFQQTRKLYRKDREAFHRVIDAFFATADDYAVDLDELSQEEYDCYQAIVETLNMGMKNWKQYSNGQRSDYQERRPEPRPQRRLEHNDPKPPSTGVRGANYITSKDLGGRNL